MRGSGGRAVHPSEIPIIQITASVIPAIKILTYFLQGLYYLFALNMDQKYIKPMKNKNKLDSNEFYDLEKNYIFLSMFAKSLLSWTIWSATLRPNRND